MYDPILFWSGILGLMGCICSFICGAVTFRKKVKFVVVYIPKDFYYILVKNGMPTYYSSEQANRWLDSRLSSRNS